MPSGGACARVIGVIQRPAFTNGVVGWAASLPFHEPMATVVNDAGFLMRQSPGVTCDAATEAAAAGGGADPLA